MVAPSADEVTDPQTGEVVRPLVPVVPGVFKCPHTGAALPDENPDQWVYAEDAE